VRVQWTDGHSLVRYVVSDRSMYILFFVAFVCSKIDNLSKVSIFSGSMLMTVGRFQLPASQSGTLSRISSGTRWSVQTPYDVYS